MNRRVFFSIILAALFCMTGCRLAKDEPAQQGDMLAGVLVTTEYLDLFDFGSYFMDNAGKLASGGSIGPEDSAKYSGFVWAEQQSRELTSEGADDDAEVVEHVFPGIGGIRFMAATATDEGGDSYWTSESDDGISDGSVHFIDTDDEKAVELDGTVYVAPAAGDTSIFYINPIYQAADGRVYAVPGEGIAFGSGIEGGGWSQTMEETATVTEIGESRRYRTKVTINIQCIGAPADIAVIEMDPESSVISRAEYAAGEVPGVIGTAAEYIIVETRDSGGSVNRELFGRDCTSFSTFCCREDGICIAKNTEIAWQE